MTIDKIREQQQLVEHLSQQTDRANTIVREELDEIEAKMKHTKEVLQPKAEALREQLAIEVKKGEQMIVKYEALTNQVAPS